MRVLFKKWSLFLVLLGLSCVVAVPDTLAKKDNRNVHFIGAWYGGFFASFMCVLNHLSWCEKNNQIPVVYWDNRSLYYSGRLNGSDNVWEYYFEPVSSVNYRPSKPINLQFTAVTPDAIEFCQDYIDQNTRKKAYALISKYIKIKSNVKHKIDDFYQRYMARKRTIGIHLRGTDKGSEEGLINPEKIVAVALRYADKDTQFLIASDEQRSMTKMIFLLQGHSVIYYNCYRSDNGKPIHLRYKKPSFAQLGEDVLVEASLLAQCDLFIHTFSNVSSSALYLNPHLEHILVRQDGLPSITD